MHKTNDNLSIDTPSPFFRQGLYALAVLSAILVFVFLAVLNFPGAGRDDVFITLWAGETLGELSWFANYNFMPQEMSSSIFGALIAYLLKVIVPNNIFLANKLLGLIVSAYTLCALWLKRRTFFPDKQSDIFVLIACVATALSPVFQYWTMGGLETPYQCLALLIYAVAFNNFFQSGGLRSIYLLSIVQILHVLIRPEGFWLIFVTGFLLILCKQKRYSLRQIFWILILPSIGFCMLVGVRYVQTGSIFPNPVYAKVTLKTFPLIMGLKYLLAYYTSNAYAFLHLISVCLSCGLIVYNLFIRYYRNIVNADNISLIVLSVIVAVQELFIIAVGGNWMEYFRFIMPTLPLKNLIIALIVIRLFKAFKSFQNKTANRLFYLTATAVLLVLCLSQKNIDGYNPLFNASNCSYPLAADFFKGKLTGMNHRLIMLNKPHKAHYEAIFPFITGPLKNYVKKAGKVKIVTYQAGLFPYMVRKYFGVDDVEFIDTAGLINNEISKLKVAKTHTGNIEASRIDKILRGEAGQLSTSVLSKNPNMVYMLCPTPNVIQKLENKNFKVVWSKWFGTIFTNISLQDDNIQPKF